MSFDETCVRCGRHLYAFCADAPPHGHVGWVLMGDDAAWCVGCLRDRVEASDGRA